MQTSVLRMLTCGSVDDGKSTLIGRLLVQTDSVPHDTVGAARNVRRAGSTIAAGEIDFSLLTDGLEAEREQGITIDVAYRSMSLLDGRRLIISDAPVHEQYTRNMAVAASRADIAIVLIDATKGVRTQTLRHLMICNLMGVSRVIVAINKLDAVDYSQEIFTTIKNDLLSQMSRFDLPDIHFIPMSALAGDNVVTQSTVMPWYTGQTLLECIQSWQPKKSEEITMRARVQSIARAEDFRGISTTIYRGSVAVGEQVRIHPSNQIATISTIVADMKNVKSADEGDAVTLVLQPEVDVTRGDLIASINEEVSASDRFSAHLVWLNEEALIHSRSYLLISGPTQIPVIVTKIRHSIDVNTGE